MAILQKDFFKLANVTQHSQFQKFMEDIVLDKERREQFYRGCVKVDPQCVEEDTFRQYFEEFAAERKSNQQDFTPQSITKLMAKLTDNNDKYSTGWTAYDCAAGTGAMILSKWKKERDKYFPWDYRPHNYLYFCQELSDITIPYLIHNLALRGMNAIVVHGDTLERTANQIYFIQNAKDDPLQFSSVNVMPHTDQIKDFFDISKWTQDQIDHIEDELGSVVWNPLLGEKVVEYTLEKASEEQCS